MAINYERLLSESDVLSDYNGQWLPAVPEQYTSFWQSLADAWGVLRGRYVAFDTTPTVGEETE